MKKLSNLELFALLPKNIRESKLSKNDKLVLGVFFRLNGLKKAKENDGWFFRSMQDLSSDVNKSVPTTTNAVKELVKIGLVSKRTSSNSGTATEYKLNLDAIAKYTEKNSAKRTDNESVNHKNFIPMNESIDKTVETTEKKSTNTSDNECVNPQNFIPSTDSIEGTEKNSIKDADTESVKSENFIPTERNEAQLADLQSERSENFIPDIQKTEYTSKVLNNYDSLNIYVSDTIKVSETTEYINPNDYNPSEEEGFTRLPSGTLEETYVKKAILDTPFGNIEELYRFYRGSDEWLRQQVAIKRENLTKEQLNSVLTYFRDFMTWRAKKEFGVDLLQYHAERLSKNFYRECVLNNCETPEEVNELANITKSILDELVNPTQKEEWRDRSGMMHTIDKVRPSSIQKIATAITEEGVLDAVFAQLHKVFAEKRDELLTKSEVFN